jgi:DNA-binding response OmpR family regulator
MEVMNRDKTILIVDDDEKIRRLLRRCFEADGYSVVEAASAREVDDQIALTHVDLVTLDLQLGDDDGLSIAKSLRTKVDIPIIMVTGKGDVIDKVVGLEMGADDYISKPFHIREVQARVRAHLRRSDRQATGEVEQDTNLHSEFNEPIFEFVGWRADQSTYELRDPTGQICDLTTTDFKLLMIFLNSPKRVLSRDHIMDQLNGQSWSPYDRTVDNQVARLRKKLEVQTDSPSIIKTIRGVGYMFTADIIKS